MSDLISRSALLEALGQDKKSICSHVYASVPCSDVDNLEFELEYLIMCQPTVEAKPVEWISVTELDLDHNQEALIKLDDGFICSAKFLISANNNCGFYHKHIGFLQCPQVVAWMPYKEDMRGVKNE